MGLRSLLQDRKHAIVAEWLDSHLAAYAGDTSRFLRREKNRFANPVGHTMRVETEALFECLLEKRGPEAICRHLDEIIKIRAIQDFSPSQAVSFVFDLKGIIRQELGSETMGRENAAELAAIEAEIDQIALFAFDIYTRRREQMYRLRIDEVKRSVSAVMTRLGGEESGPGSAPEPNGDRASCRGGDQ